MDKNIPQLRFHGFWEEWVISSLLEIGEFKNGINKSKDDFGFGYPFVNLMDVFGKPIIKLEGLGLVNANEKEKELYRLKTGDVLFIRSSVKREGVGETSLVINDDNQAIFSGFLIRFRDSKVPLDLHFKRYCFWTARFRYNLISLSTTSANTNINQESLNQLDLILPTLPEQQKIASFFTAIDRKISQLKRKKTLLEQYKKGVMQKLFDVKTDGRPTLRFKDDKGQEFPGWERKKLRDIATFFSGGTPATTNKSFYEGDIPFIKSGEIGFDKTEQFITSIGLKNSSARLVEEGSILYALYGATSGEVAISKINGAINQAVLCIKSNENHFFIYSFLRFKKDSIIKTYLQGGQGNLSAEIVKNLEIGLPSLPEQTKIANFLSSIDDKITQTQKQIEKAGLWKKGLMQQMFV